jgi:hypothetical protein
VDVAAIPAGRDLIPLNALRFPGVATGPGHTRDPMTADLPMQGHGYQCHISALFCAAVWLPADEERWRAYLECDDEIQLFRSECAMREFEDQDLA